MATVGRVNNTSNVGARKWRHIFDHQGRLQKLIWTCAGILSIGLLGTTFDEIWTQIQHLYPWKFIRNCRLQNGGHIVLSLKLFLYCRWPAGHMAEDPLNCVAVRASDGVWFEQECAADVEFSTVQYKFICRRNKGGCQITCASCLPMKEDVTYVTSSLIGWDQ